LALPVRLIGGPGQENDICSANQLIEGFKANAALADKGYDADALLQKLQKQDCKPVIPPKKNRKLQRGYDKDLYIGRNLIERFFNKLKQFRRVATRYDKLLANFMGFVKIAAIAIWIK
jgi:putative transposase